MLSPRLLALSVTAIVSAGSAGAHCAHDLEELVVTGHYDTRTVDVSDALIISPDTARLLKHAPGANINGNGPLTGIPQYRGMYGPRIATSMDGRQLAPAGPNWMDPPLSYAAAGQLESLEIYRGIVPVSVAQESIGGAIEVHTNRGDYGSSDNWQLNGKIAGNAQSVNGGSHLNAALYGSNQSQRIKVAAMTEAGNDAEFPGGDITPSEYKRQRYDLGYGFRSGPHSIQLDYSYNDTGDTGTAALPMDIDYIKGKLLSLDYNYTRPQGLTVEASVYGSQLGHGMTNYHLRQAPEAKRWRQNIADSDNLGIKLMSSLKDDNGSWTLGFDGFTEKHDSDIDNPNNPMFFVVNFNGAEREVLGLFVERHQDWQSWNGQFGVRYNRVTSNANEVDSSSAMIIPPVQRLRDNFNNAERKQTDDNLDLVAKLTYNATKATSWYTGIAQKHRSPSYQERYLWLPLEATGGLADGNTYTGNITLKPEVSRQLEFGLDFSSENFTLSPRFFYHRVDDYIQGTQSEVAPAIMLVRMMNAANGTSNPAPLQFNNVDATLYGFDMDWRWSINNNWSLSGIINYVRGVRDDVNDNLYRIAPPNTSFRMSYHTGNWNTGVETIFYAKQDNISETNAEKETSEYGLLNINASWHATKNMHFSGGIDNVFNREYREHLSGYNRASNPDIAKGERLSAYGTNVFISAQYSF